MADSTLRRKKLARFKEYVNVGTTEINFRCAAIAPMSNLIVTGDENCCMNLWSFTQHQPLC